MPAGQIAARPKRRRHRRSSGPPAATGSPGRGGGAFRTADTGWVARAGSNRAADSTSHPAHGWRGWRGSGRRSSPDVRPPASPCRPARRGRAAMQWMTSLCVSASTIACSKGSTCCSALKTIGNGSWACPVSNNVSKARSSNWACAALATRRRPAATRRAMRAVLRSFPSSMTRSNPTLSATAESGKWPNGVLCVPTPRKLGHSSERKLKTRPEFSWHSRGMMVGLRRPR